MSKAKKYLRNKYVIIGIVVVAIILFFFWRSTRSTTTLEFATATIGNVVEKVSVTGKILAVEKASLAFEKGGIITTIAHKVGDNVKRGDLIASLEGASDKAALASAQAQLADISRGLRPEEFASDQAALSTASTSLMNAEKNALIAIRDGYVKAQSSIVNYADNFFQNPQSANPTISIRTDSSTFQSNINQERIAVTDTLRNWKNIIDTKSDPADAGAALTQVENYLSSIKNFLSDMSATVNNLNPGNSGMSQSAIDTAVTTMNTALSTFTQAASSINTADATLKNAASSYSQVQSQFTLQQAGSSAQSIAAAQAKVAGAQAELNKDRIISPIDGVLTRAEPDLGQYIAPGIEMFAVQSDGAFKIEANIPEADIAKVSLGNEADVTLDAYGSDVHFAATVTAIDPAETVLEGVPTYKVTLTFQKPDPRIRSGMTANTDILTREHDNVLTVPSRAVTTTNGTKSVRVLRADGKNFDITNVTTDLKGSDGTIEITSGISPGEKVVTFVK